MATWKWIGDVRFGTGAGIISGTGDPSGVITAPVGTIFLRTDGGAGTTLYVKEVGSGNTGWKTGGSSFLANDADVLLVSPSDGQSLVFDIASGKWKNKTSSGGGSNVITKRISAGTIASGNGQYVIVDFDVAFPDELYTVSVTLETDEDISSAPVIVGSVKRILTGVGVNVWIQNMDSINHVVTIHVAAEHD